MALIDEVEPPRTPRWITRALMGAGLSLTMLGCTGSGPSSAMAPGTPPTRTTGQGMSAPAGTDDPKDPSQDPKTVRKSMVPPDVDVYGAPPVSRKPVMKQAPVPDIVAEYAVVHP